MTKLELRYWQKLFNDNNTTIQDSILFLLDLSTILFVAEAIVYSLP